MPIAANIPPGPDLGRTAKNLRSSVTPVPPDFSLPAKTPVSQTRARGTRLNSRTPLRSGRGIPAKPDLKKFECPGLARTEPLLAAGGDVRVGQNAVGGGPNSQQGLARTDKESCRGQTHKREQQRILDQVLALLITNETNDELLHVPTILLVL